MVLREVLALQAHKTILICFHYFFQFFCKTKKQLILKVLNIISHEMHIQQHLPVALTKKI